MSTDPNTSRLQMAIEKMDEAEGKLQRQARDIELRDASQLSPETKQRLAELAAAMESIQSARSLLKELQNENQQ